MKKLIFLIPILMVSCAEYKAVMAEETTNIINEKVYFSDANKQLITVTINDVPHTLLFDTGASATLLHQPKFSVDEKKKIRERSVYGFDKKTKIKAFNYSAKSMQTEIFSVKDKFLYVTEASKNTCDTIERYDGILGNFYESDLMLALNYEHGYLQFLDRLDTAGWTEIPAKISGTTGKFYVALEVNGVKDFFLFDTGNATMVYLNKEVFQQPEKQFYAIDMLARSVGNSSTTIRMEVYEGRFVAGNLNFVYPVSIDASSKRSVLSKNFIDNFNWVFDRKNEKAYFKPIDPKKIESRINMLAKKDQLQVSNIDEKLIVSFKNFESTFQIGDQVTSVNGELITAENICEMRDMLNRQGSWSALNLTSKKAE